MSPARAAAAARLSSLVICNLLVALNWLLFTLIAAHRVAMGQTFTYPMTIRRP